ncbi:unnamed protein product [Bursaphelenchus xylophilus]|uniref:(pine wood nematode) hypothetical protein n=1 Tax=Bursaphelenchus xylophilus TaxID=6326 RepID=A0A1I7RZ57_BURXY|nr:unnamed protein product [Bursaphelenchus xylophilus]CAG9106829.1 unnamed protein product [Bursaphelenchus xylophilus]
MAFTRLGILILMVELGQFVLAGRTLTKEECLKFERSNFIQRAPKVVRVYESDPAYLHCTVPHSNNNLVAWTRLTDDALLTAGGQSFTSDSRFQISPKREARDWVLNIRRVMLSDSGCYMCEINTEPQSTQYTVYLEVFKKKETPTNKPETSVTVNKPKTTLTARMEGSTIILNCTVEADRHSTIDVLWTKDRKPVDLFDEKKYVTSYKTVSRNLMVYVLKVNEASHQDDGQYACEGEEFPQQSQTVHINAALVSSPNSSSFPTLNYFILLLCVITHPILCL